MKRKIKTALCVRVVVLLVGPGLYLLTNIFIINTRNNSDAPTNDEFTFRRLLNVEDHESRGGVSEVQSDLLAVKNHSDAEDHASDILRRPADFNLPAERVKRVVSWFQFSYHGRISLQIIASCYCFLMLAIICDEYFIGCVEVLCQKLNMKEDVAGATFMAIATSSPEFIISCIGTFITEGDVGVGTIVGSAVFNVLAIPAICGIYSTAAIQLDWWPISRDFMFCGFSVIALIAVISDNQIMWYEAACLFGAYLIYLYVMFKNKTLSEKAKMLARKVRRQLRHQAYSEVAELTPLISRDDSKKIAKCETVIEISDPSKFDETEEYATSPWRIPTDANVFLYFAQWPITLILWLTIPDSRRFRSYYVLTFVNCVLWIGCISYTVVSFSSNVDSVLGLIFLAAGTSLPEATSSVLVSLQGHGTIGISNSLGSNTFDILLCLGLPWLIKTLLNLTKPGAQASITLKSTNFTYSSISLLTTLFLLYCVLFWNKFKLTKAVGWCCAFCYFMFIIYAVLVQMNVFVLANPAMKF